MNARTLVDMTHAPYHPVASRIIHAIGYAASYEDVGLYDADNEIIEYWMGLEIVDGEYTIEDSEIVDKIIDILSDHGYSLYVAEDYPGLWVIENVAKDD